MDIYNVHIYNFIYVVHAERIVAAVIKVYKYPSYNAESKHETNRRDIILKSRTGAINSPHSRIVDCELRICSTYFHYFCNFQ